jgi:hypothetical protein
VIIATGARHHSSWFRAPNGCHVWIWDLLVFEDSRRATHVSCAAGTCVPSSCAGCAADSRECPGYSSRRLSAMLTAIRSADKAALSAVDAVHRPSRDCANLADGRQTADCDAGSGCVSRRRKSCDAFVSTVCTCIYVCMYVFVLIMLLGISYELKNGVFWDVTPCSSCKNRPFGGS